MPTLYLGSQRVTPMSVSGKNGVTVDLFTARTLSNGTLTYPQALSDKHIVYDGVKNVGNSGLFRAFSRDAVNYFAYSSVDPETGAYTSNGHYADEIKSVSFPDLEEVNGSYACYNAFDSQTGITSISFPKLKRVSGRSAMGNMFSYVNKVETIEFPELEEITRSPEPYDNTFASFMYCSDNYSTEYRPSATLHEQSLLKHVRFPKLRLIDASSCFSGAFANQPNIESIEFPALEEITARGARAFAMLCYCNAKNSNGSTAQNTKLTSISFPKLTTIDPSVTYLFGGSATSSAACAFTGCPALTEIHFRPEVQSVIEAQTWYSSKFGATNATIYFDLTD